MLVVGHFSKNPSSAPRVVALLSSALGDFPPAVLALRMLVERRLPGRVLTAFLARGLFAVARAVVPRAVAADEAVFEQARPRACWRGVPRLSAPRLITWATPAASFLNRRARY